MPFPPKRLKTGIALLCACLGIGSAWAQLTGTARAVPTYESVGLYWTNPGASPATGCEVRYRRTGDAAWRQGLTMWFDSRNNECRGSLVHLTADTQYQVEMALPGNPPTQTLTFRTWPNQRPVAARIPVASGTATLNITVGGTAAGYVVYDGARGAVLDAQGTVPYNVTINASFVIVRGLVLRGAGQDAIRISPTVTDVIIEDNEITGWGRQRSGNLGVEQDSAIHAVCSLPTLERVTIQRNEIHDPRYSSNSWSDGHPEGPQAISFYNCGGNHVIRHNEIFNTTGRYYNDIIGGGPNDGNTGFPNGDTDIYGNELSHAWDDAIEAEGGNRNVRIWGNYIDSTGTGIATTPTGIGPIYLFRNVYNRSRLLEKSPPDADDRQVMFKAGADAALGNGKRYIFHNTTLQATQAGVTYGLGASGGISGVGSSRPVNNTVSRNNIFHNWRSWSAYFDVGTGNDFGSDMFNGSAGAPVSSPIVATPTYLPGHGWQSEMNGWYQLAPGTPGYDAGARIANFNDAYVGAAPDVGAHEGGTGQMRFGIAASPGPAAGSLDGDLAIVQAPSANPASAGKDLAFLLTVTNNGNVDATNVVITDTLPAATAFVWAPTNCTPSGSTVTCSMGTVGPGASAQVRIVMRPASAGTASNVAAVSASQPDAYPANNSSTVAVTVNATPAGVPVLRYRLYSDVSKEHHFTTDLNEYNTLGAMGWQKEGSVGKVLNNPGSFNGVQAVPYYRLYDNQTHWHHWTTDPNEYYTLIQFPWWSAEGVDGYIFPTQAPGTIPLYRLLYPPVAGLHHWTIDAYEYGVLTSSYGWVGEGGSGYVIP